MLKSCKGGLTKAFSRLLGLTLGILFFVTPSMAEAGGTSDQCITEGREWNGDITTPCSTNDKGTYTYYGLYLKHDPAVDSYSVYSTIALNLEDKSSVGRSATNIYGIYGSKESGMLRVGGKIDITGAGWMPLAEEVSDRPNTAVMVTGIRSYSYNNLESLAALNLFARGGTSVATSSASNEVYANALAFAGGVLSNGAVSHVGDITIATRGGSAVAISSASNEANANANANANASADGIWSNGAVSYVGDITITTRGGSALAELAVSSDSKLSIYAGARADSVSTARGIYCEGDVTHSGNITITTKGGAATAIATGNVYSRATVYANATATGISCEGDVTHSGDIKISISGGTAKVSEAYFASADADAFASGIFSYGAVLNNGDITVAAKGGAATAPAHDYADANTSATANGILSSGGAVTNNGTINVFAQAGIEKRDGHTTSAEAKAYGIHFWQGAALSSSGLISASAQFALDVDPPTAGATSEAYQVFCESGTLAIKQYAMEVGHDQDTFTAMYEGQIGTSSGVVLFDNAELVVHILDDYQDGVYDIPRLWKQETAQHDQFTTAVTASAIPGLNVSLIPSTGGTPQRVVMEYAPQESTPLKQALVQMNVEKQIHSLIQNHLSGHILSSMLSANTSPSGAAEPAGIYGSTSSMVASLSNPNVLPAVTAKEAKQQSIFFRPVYVNSYDSASSGYSSNSYGFVFGYDYRRPEDTNDAVVGVHAGYTRGDIRYTGAHYGDRKEFVDTYYGGVHGITRFAEDFVLSGEASFFYSDSDMRDDNPANRGKAEYDSVAIRAEAAVGYLWDVVGHTIIPEAGLSYSWQHRDSFTASNQHSSDISYGTLDNNELYASARVKWLKQYALSNGWMITPLLGAGITQILTDGELSNSMRFGNETQMVVDQDENTTFTPEANITISSDGYYAIAGYTGGFGGTTTNNMFWLQMGVYF